MKRVTRLLMALGLLAVPALVVPAAARADNFSVSFGTPGSNVYYSGYNAYGYGYRPRVVYHAPPPVAYYGPTYYAPPRRVVVVDRSWDRGWDRGRGHYHRPHHWDRGPGRGVWHRGHDHWRHR